MSGIGFGKKLYISSVGIIVLTILIVAGMNFFESKETYLANGQAGIQSVSDVLKRTVEVQYGLQKAKLETDMGMFKTQISASGKITTVASRTADIDARDIRTGETVKLTVPKLVAGFKFITADYEMVDAAGKLSDSEIMVFQLFQNRLVKVSTSMKSKGEERSIGSFYGQESPQAKAIQAETPLLFLEGRGEEKTINLISPFKDELEDHLAGAFGIGRKVLTPELKALVERITVNGKGYAFISDKEGKILVHPDKSYIGTSVRDFSGGEALMKTKDGVVAYDRNRDSYVGYTTYFQPWDLYLTVAVSRAELMAGVNGRVLKSAGTSGLIALVIGLLIVAVMNRQLMTSMTGMAAMAKEVAGGNFKYSFSYLAKDAIRDTVTAMNDMVGGLAQMIRNLNTGVETLNSASGELSLISDRMKEGTDTSVEKVNNVASAAEEMSVNMDSVAAAMEEASTNVEAVSAGMGRMKEDLETVVRDSARTREITGKAVDQARLASERVKRLGQAAEEINKVTDAINTISNQTNLLALNATIEAARAGDAGKGFAVVAGEIKALAGQTADATQEIGQNIRDIQEQIQGAVSEIRNISEIVGEINTFVNQASQSIEGQASTTGEITRNIGQVTLGIQEISENVAQSSAVSGQVAQEISDVLDVARQVAEFSGEVKKKAQILDGVMNQLTEMTQKFQI